MGLVILEEAIQPVYEDLSRKDFSSLLRDARDAIGLKLYRAAEFMGVAPARLKNLETGYFRVMPTEAEINAIAQLYDIKAITVKEKATKHVKQREKAKKIRTINEEV